MEINLEQITQQVMGLVTSYGFKVIGALATLIGAWIVAGWMQKIVLRGLNKTKFDATLAKFFSNTVRYAVILFAVIGCLGIFGIETTSFAAVLGAAGLAVGLAFQGSLSNIAAGVMLLAFRPFKVDEVVTVAGQTGKVNEISLFTTELTTPDNRKIILPNSSIFGSTIENATHYPTRRVNVDVGVEYSANIDKTRSVLEAAAKGVSGVLEDPATQIYLVGLGASSVDWQVRVWCKTADYWQVKEDVIRAVKSALDEASIGIPFPQMELHFASAAQESIKHLAKGAGNHKTASV